MEDEKFLADMRAKSRQLFRDTPTSLRFAKKFFEIENSGVPRNSPYEVEDENLARKQLQQARAGLDAGKENVYATINELPPAPRRPPLSNKNT